MPTTVMQDKNFAYEMFGTEKLEQAIEWIQKNLSPEDVFNQEQLDNWAQGNNYTGPEES